MPTNTNYGIFLPHPSPALNFFSSSPPQKHSFFYLLIQRNSSSFNPFLSRLVTAIFLIFFCHHVNFFNFSLFSEIIQVVFKFAAVRLLLKKPNFGTNSPPAVDRTHSRSSLKSRNP